MTCDKCGKTFSDKNLKCDCYRKNKVEPHRFKDTRFFVATKNSGEKAKPEIVVDAEVITKEEKENAAKTNLHKSGKGSENSRKDNPETDTVQD